MMMRLLVRNYFKFSQKFKIDDYDNQDYATMCGLLKEKYQLNNEEIQTSGLIKLIDQEGKVIGIYTASEARKKSKALGMDMVLVNKKVTPFICRASDFRNRIIDKFYNQIILKRQKELLTKASSIKSLKVSATLNTNQMTIKLKQVVQLSRKNLKVRVFMMVRDDQQEQCLSRLQSIKSQLLNSCYIEEQISSKRFDDEQEQQEEISSKKQKYKTFSFVVKARQNQILKNTLEQKNMSNDNAIKHFLRKYYRQDDGQMMDLKSAGKFQIDNGLEEIDLQLMQKPGIQQVDDQEPSEDYVDVNLIREAEARILNNRLKILLSFHK